MKKGCLISIAVVCGIVFFLFVIGLIASIFAPDEIENPSPKGIEKLAEKPPQTETPPSLPSKTAQGLPEAAQEQETAPQEVDLQTKEGDKLEAENKAPFSPQSQQHLQTAAALY